MSLGANIKAARNQQAISQRELAERINVSDAYIALLETDQRTNPSLEVLKKLSSELGVPIEILLKNKAEPTLL